MRTFSLFFLLLGFLLSACAPPVSTLSSEAQAEIYAAAVRQVVTVDDTFGGTLNPDTLYIVSTTDDSTGDPDIEQQPPTSLPEELQQAILAELTDLDATLLWVPSRENVELTSDTSEVVTADGVGVIITLGNLQPQDDDSVHLSTSIYIANLAAGGQTYVLQEIDGAWQVTGTTGAAWIS